MNQVLQSIDVAARLNCSVELVRAMARSGKLPSMRTPSGLRVYRAEDVERLAVEREKQKQGKAKQENRTK